MYCKKIKKNILISERFSFDKIFFILAGLLSIFFLFYSPITLFSQKFPSPAGFVNDFAGVIDQSTEQKISSICTSLQQKTQAEIAVVTVNTIEPYATIEEYSIDLATSWGIGKKGEDTGILILLTMQERRVRIEVGYGLEGIIPDGLAGDIIDRSILPHLKAGDYSTGLLKGVEAVSGIIAEEYGIKIEPLDVSESSKYTSRSSFPIGLIAMIILFFLFGFGRLIFWPLLFLGGFSGRRYYGGGFGSGGSGGGFSGFGGGGFGGGGASRGF